MTSKSRLGVLLSKQSALSPNPPERKRKTIVVRVKGYLLLLYVALLAIRALMPLGPRKMARSRMCDAVWCVGFSQSLPGSSLYT